jgi:hypothetical protein
VVQKTCKRALIYLQLPSATSCPVLPVVSEWYQKATGAASRPLSNERTIYTLTVPRVRGDASSRSPLSLDTEYGQACRRGDGRNVGLGDLYSGPSLPLGGSSERSHSEVSWAGCLASLTNEGSSLLSASITLHAWVAVPIHQFPTTGRTPTTPTLHLIPPLLPR